MRVAFERRRNLMVKMAQEIPDLKVSVPQGAFYLFPDVSAYLGKTFQGRSIQTGADLAFYLLDEAHVACVGGNAFGAPSCIRLSYAASDDLLVEAMHRIKKALLQLK
jgi:aspartate aminotransferase